MFGFLELKIVDINVLLVFYILFTPTFTGCNRRFSIKLSIFCTTGKISGNNDR